MSAKKLKVGLPKCEKDSIWQYILDHAYPRGDLYKITFCVKDRDDWERRIIARMNGLQRIDEKKLESKMENRNFGFLQWQKQANEFGIKINNITKNGSLFQKLTLFIYRKCRDYINATQPSINP